MNPCPRFLAEVERVKGCSIESAVYIVACRMPRLADDVLDFIGSWPQSEPVLRVLQQVWGKR